MPTRRAAAPTEGDALLVAAWSRMAVLYAAMRDRFFDILQHHGLTPPHGFTLVHLLDGPLRMRDIADWFHCDASYATAIVDRLEEVGYAERRANTTDRRVKEVVLTTSGRRVAASVRAALSDPPELLRSLPDVERHQLVAILERLVPEVPEGVHAFGPPKRS